MTFINLGLIILQIRFIEVEECSMLSHYYDGNDQQNSIFSKNTDEAKKVLNSTYASKNTSAKVLKKERMNINVDIVKDKLDKAINGIALFLSNI